MMNLPLAIVLDGEVSVRESAAEALRQAGVDAVTAATPQEALDIVRSWAASTGDPTSLRREDVPALTRAFVEGLRRLNRLPPISVSADAQEALTNHDWKGRVDDLRQAVETAVIVAGDGTVQVKDLPAFLRGSAAEGDRRGRTELRFRDAKRSVVDAFERSYLSELLARHGGNVTAAAEQSGMLRSALQRLLRKHDIRSSSFRGRPSAGVDAS
jgi:DNA-binding NtrC family response regulator